jgi:thiamine-phosphate pyrophosphorylase
MTTVRQEREGRFAAAGVYPVITPEFCGGRDPLWVARELVAAGAQVLQLRVKSGPDRAFLELALRFRELTSAAGCLLIINDRADLAELCEADGVHAGQDDLPPDALRRLFPDGIIGASTHNRDELLAAQAHDLSTLNLGPIYATATKVNPMAPLGLETLRALAPLIRVPFSVMGGIKERHLPELRDAGARLVAMVTELTQADRPGEVLARMLTVMRG